MLNPEYKVSVCIITYNQADYIEETIKGILSQKVSFNVEIIIAEDCSPDNTGNIIEHYISNCPDNFNIKYFRHDKNLGPIRNLDWALKKCEGEYIAWCEGDDFWTDNLKLNKQIEILDHNPSVAMSTHNALVKYEYLKKQDEFFNTPKSFEKSIFAFDDILDKWFIPSASMVFRKKLVTQIPDWYKTVYNGDWTLQLLASSKYGDIHYLDEVMCVYRRNEKSLSYNVGFDLIKMNKNKIYILNNLIKEVNFAQKVAILKKINTLEGNNQKLKFNLKYLIKVLLKYYRLKFNL
ncbi:MAG: hypothetical protein COA32_13125 [Fluviicola sp.]|nr:MAG: hypothetical protein COA32_13125 [Fluviicola sp.]